MNLFQNLLKNPRFWPVDATVSRTLLPLQNRVTEGQWTDSTKYVCGFFVIKGDLDTVARRSAEIDRSFAAPFMGKVEGPGLDDFAAHATTTFVSLHQIDATAMLFWAPPRFPTDLAIGAITAYNRWARQLREEGILLDAGRMNVRRQATHVIGKQVLNGPFTGDQLVGIGSAARSGPGVADALLASGLADDPDTVVSIQACNGWCKAFENEAPEDDDPLNSIFV
ncbi:MAG: hypothetical protein R2729_05165 [Bryobacteraceae bacterium]